jgi:hypothetical protein
MEKWLHHDVPMKATFSIIALFIGAACSAQPSGQEAAMDAIEAAVELPAGAKVIEDYSRNYALRPDGKVIGVYVTPRPTEARDSEYGCDVMLEDGDSRPCTEAEEAENAAFDKALADNLGRAGQSRWFEDYRELPTILDGGCGVVKIIFDPHSQRIESAECYGEA